MHIPNELTHRTTNDPSQWQIHVLSGTNGPAEINAAFRTHSHQFIWTLMNAGCCGGHGDFQIRVVMNANYRKYRTTQANGYIYPGRHSDFRNIIIVTENCNVGDLNIQVQDITEPEEQAEYLHNHCAIAIPDGVRLHQVVEGQYIVRLSDVDTLWEQYHFIQQIMNITID